jgi:large subunit ribosomal protein L24
MNIKLKIKTGDTVKVITGNHKGIIGKIISIDKKKFNIVLDSLPKKLKNVKTNFQDKKEKNLEILTYIHISNIMPWDDKSKIISKIGYQFINNKKTRVYKKSGNIL